MWQGEEMVPYQGWGRLARNKGGIACVRDTMREAGGPLLRGHVEHIRFFREGGLLKKQHPDLSTRQKSARITASHSGLKPSSMMG